MAERIAPILLVSVLFVFLLYWNYLAWFDVEKYHGLVQYWKKHSERYKNAPGGYWWFFVFNERQIRVLLLIGLIMVLGTLIFIIVDPMNT